MNEIDSTFTGWTRFVFLPLLLAALVWVYLTTQRTCLLFAFMPVVWWFIYVLMRAGRLRLWQISTGLCATVAISGFVL